MNPLCALLFLIISLIGFVLISITTCCLAESLSTQEITDRVVIDLHDLENREHFREFIRRWLTDGFLLLIMMLQHSGMATICWKEFLSGMGLEPVTRALYVIATGGALQLLLRCWQPLPASPLWEFDTQSYVVAWTVFFVLHVLMWGILLFGLMAMDLPEMLGLKQVYYYAMGWNDPIEYKSRSAQNLLRGMRHSGAFCLLVILWVHPVMSLGRFLLASNWTLYLLCGHSLTVTDYTYVEDTVTARKVLVAEVRTKQK